MEASLFLHRAHADCYATGGCCRAGEAAALGQPDGACGSETQNVWPSAGKEQRYACFA